MISENSLPREVVGFSVPSSGSPMMTVSGLASGTPSGPVCRQFQFAKNAKDNIQFTTQYHVNYPKYHAVLTCAGKDPRLLENSPHFLLLIGCRCLPVNCTRLNALVSGIATICRIGIRGGIRSLVIDLAGVSVFKWFQRRRTSFDFIGILINERWTYTCTINASSSCSYKIILCFVVSRETHISC